LTDFSLSTAALHSFWLCSEQDDRWGVT
jgi:hypothetical protein